MASLGPRAVGAGHRLEQVAEIGSTSAELLERAQAGERGPVWLLSDVQTAGRGRNARPWASPVGNLYVSLLLSDPCPPANVSELSFVLSVALRDATLAATGLHELPGLRLKWPNDLLLEGSKTAGLLLEGGLRAGTPFVVAGFGVNIVSHPDGTSYRATHLAAAGLTIERDALLSALSDAVVRRLEQWESGMRFDIIRRDWLKVAYGLGQPLRVATINESFEAVFDGIDLAGRLVATTAEGRRLVSAGDVFPLALSAGEAVA